MKNQSRRNFVKTAASSAALLPLAGTLSMEAKPKNMKNLFLHQVYFWLKNPGNEADRAKLVECLKTLTAIKTIKSYHLGITAGSSRDVVDGSFDISWLNVFKDRAAQDAYQIDPIHLKFIDDYKHLWDRVIVYDSVNV